jgi:hypothetical protein
MKPIIVENSKIPKMLSLVIKINAITLWPFIFFRGVADERTTRHESIHIAQYNELFVVGFLVLYFYDWLKGLIKYRNKKEAYFNIRFEQEAYMYDITDDYLKNRRKYEWRKFNV